MTIGFLSKKSKRPEKKSITKSVSILSLWSALHSRSKSESKLNNPTPKESESKPQPQPELLKPELLNHEPLSSCCASFHNDDLSASKSDNTTKNITDFSVGGFIAQYQDLTIPTVYSKPSRPASTSSNIDLQLVNKLLIDEPMGFEEPEAILTPKCMSTPGTPKMSEVSVPDNIDNLSFDEVLSHSTTRQSSGMPTRQGSNTVHNPYIAPINTKTMSKFNLRESYLNDHFTEEGSIINASIQIFKAYTLAEPHLKLISAEQQSPVPSIPQDVTLSPTSISPSPAPKIKNIHNGSIGRYEADRSQSESAINETTEIQSTPMKEAPADEIKVSENESLIDEEDELTFDDHKDMFRSELVSLVEKHKAMIRKQQDEIKHLRGLLVQEKKITSILSFSPQQNHCKSFPGSVDCSDSASLVSSTSENESKSSKHRRRKHFIPMNIVFSQETPSSDNVLDVSTKYENDLLPPFKPVCLPGNINEAFPAKDESQNSIEKPRNVSVSSNVSSIMSISHHKVQKINVGNILEMGSKVDDQSNDSLSYSNQTTPDSATFPKGTLKPGVADIIDIYLA